MDLQIELAWCNHWVRNRLGIPPNGSIILFVEDARASASSSRSNRRKLIQHAISEARWQFANPTFVMLSITDRSTNLRLGPRMELYGLVDQQHNSNNATDLCGWIGASKSIFLIASLASTNREQIDEAKESSTLHLAIKDVCSGFGKPWNLIPETQDEINHLKLDWESLHQPNPIDRGRNQPFASTNFAQAVQRLENAIQQRNDPIVKPSQKPREYRQAG